EARAERGETGEELRGLVSRWEEEAAEKDGQTAVKVEVVPLEEGADRSSQNHPTQAGCVGLRCCGRCNGSDLLHVCFLLSDETVAIPGLSNDDSACRIRSVPLRPTPARSSGEAIGNSGREPVARSRPTRSRNRAQKKKNCHCTLNWS